MARKRCYECGRFIKKGEMHECKVQNWTSFSEPKILQSGAGAIIRIPFASRTDAMRYAKKHRIPAYNATYGG